MSVLLRLGRREAGRHRLRSALVISLIAVPVATGVVAMVLFPYVAQDGRERVVEELGAADLRVDGPVPAVSAGARVSELAGVESVLDGAKIVEASTSTAWVPVGSGTNGEVTSLGVEQVDSGDPVVAARFPVEDGRRPTRPGEVMLTRSALDRFHVDVGDVLALAAPAIDLQVVGEMRAGTACGRCRAGVVAPGTFAAPAPEPTEVAFDKDWSDRRYLRLAPAVREQLDVDPGSFGLTLGGIQAEGYSVWDRASVATWGTSRQLVATWTVIGGAFVLFWTGLVAASGLAIGARRRTRELGLLAANGADPRSMRIAVVAEGLVLGVIGAGLGVAAGLIVAEAAAPSVREAAHSFSTTTAVPVVGVVALACCGVLAAVAAARAAAAGLTRLTPAALLAGRRTAPRAAPSWLAAGLVCLLLGVVGLRLGRAVSSEAGQRVSSAIYVAAVAALAVGTVAFVVGATRLAGRLTRNGALAVRLAGRDLARQGLRVAAACAAVSLTLSGAMAIATSYESDRVPDQRGAMIESREVRPDPRIAELVASEERLVDGRIERPAPTDAVLASLVARGWSVGTIGRQLAVGELENCFPQLVGQPGSGGEQCLPATVAVVDDRMLELVPASLRTALEEGGVATLTPQDMTTRLVGGPAVPVTPAVGGDDSGVLAIYASAQSIGGPDTLYMRASTAAAFGLDPARAVERAVFVDRGDAGARSLAALDRLVADEGLRLSPVAAEGGDGARWVRPAGVLAVAAVTLLIVLLSLALVRVESRGDDEVLLVAGAAPGLSRRIQGARAGLMVLVAALPAPLVGWGVVRASSGREPVAPWWAIELLVLLPLLCAVVAAASMRTPRRLRVH